MTKFLLDIDEFCEGAILLDGMEAAIVGVVNSFEGRKIMYSTEKILEILQQDGMTYSEAEEYFDYNILGLYAGGQNPVFLDYNVTPVKTKEDKWEFEVDVDVDPIS